MGERTTTNNRIVRRQRLLARRKLLPDFCLAKASGLGAQHGSNFLQTHADLIPHGNQAFGQVQVVLAQQPDGDHDIIDVAKHQGMLGRVTVLLLQERVGVLAPVTTRVEVVRGVVSVVVAETIAL